jgi:hypothetical protein
MNTTIPRELTDDMPLRVYQPSFHKHLKHKRQRFHHGQRKLCIAELEFLTNSIHNTHTKYTVIYAGAAPGTHIPLLLHMFPNTHFILYDPRRFRLHCPPHTSHRLEIHQTLFDDTKAHTMYARYQHELDQVLFISDIRSTKPRDNDNEQKILQDMQKQMEWHRIIRPYKSLLKFRLPYPDKTDQKNPITYIQGTIQLPIWGRLSTTECRLVTDRDAQDTTYDYVTYEQQMFYFNTIIRYTDHQLDIPELSTIYRNNYDDAAELRVIIQYIQKYYQFVSFGDLIDQIKMYHENITLQCKRRWMF